MPKANLRWYVKKTARVGVSLAATCARPLRSIGNPQPQVRVLTYHRIGPTPNDPFCVSQQVFDRQMQMLASEQRAVSLDQLRQFIDGKVQLPAGACLVTIDDGLISTFTGALPVLVTHGIPAVAFASSDLVGTERKAAGERYMNWEELREAADTGFLEIGSHAHSHRSLGMLSAAEAVDEIHRSRRILEDGLGRPVTSFAYPFGTGRDFNEVTENAITEAGYSIAFNSVHGAIVPGMNSVSLPRVKVEGGDPHLIFPLICDGGMDIWRLVDRGLSSLQSPRPAH